MGITPNSSDEFDTLSKTLELYFREETSTNAQNAVKDIFELILKRIKNDIDVVVETSFSDTHYINYIKNNMAIWSQSILRVLEYRSEIESWGIEWHDFISRIFNLYHTQFLKLYFSIASLSRFQARDGDLYQNIESLSRYEEIYERFTRDYLRLYEDLSSYLATLGNYVSTDFLQPPDSRPNTQEEKLQMDANTLVAAISALIDAITLWRTTRDRKESAKALQNEFEKTKKASTSEALALGNLVPNDLLEMMCDRVIDCFKKYQKILENDQNYFPEDVDGATDTVIICVCRELGRIYKLNQHIPPGKLSDWWNSYKCFSKLN